ncbi:MAG: hypothetical protein GEV06_13645 [Luteitalea sp.]|nr:hypothetical protein [Luteitalea sp.]
MSATHLTTVRLALLAIFAVCVYTPLTAQEQPLSIFIRAGEKTHGPGEHDYPRFLEDWKKLLTDRGAVVDGALRFPTEAELSKADVLIIYKGDGADITPDERVRLDGFRERGGGLVVLHDGMCGDDATWFAGVAGGAKQHGERNWWRGVLKMHLEDSSHPVLQGVSDFEMDDEGFFLLRKAPEMQALASAPIPDQGSVPQLWTYEKTLSGGEPYRAFVSLQGHYYSIFELEPYRQLLLRGIAWAGKRPIDLLTGALESAKLDALRQVRGSQVSVAERGPRSARTANPSGDARR